MLLLGRTGVIDVSGFTTMLNTFERAEALLELLYQSWELIGLPCIPVHGAPEFVKSISGSPAERGSILAKPVLKSLAQVLDPREVVE